MLSLSIDRTGLGLSALVIDSDPSGGMWLAEEGQKRPPRSWRRTYADDGLYHGSLLTGATLSQTVLPGLVYFGASTTAALEALQEEFEDATAQLNALVTQTIDGSAKVWRCGPADIDWGDIDSGEVHAHICRASVSWDAYPIAGT